MYGHAVFAVQVIDWHPPVDLAVGRGVPRVAMRMESVGNPGLKIVSWKRRAQTWNIKVGLRKIAAQLCQHSLDIHFRLGVMDKFWFQLCENFRAPVWGDVFMNIQRLKGTELFFDQLLR